jgi:hypothetical protein
MPKLLKRHQRELPSQRIPHHLAPFPLGMTAKFIEHPLKILVEPNRDRISHV